MKSMRYPASLAALAVFLLVVLSAALLWGGGSTENPKFFVRKTTVNLGEFFEGKDIKYVFSIRNNGAGELHIINVRPG
ncbi:MAG: hypothetical protein JXB45_04245 [Candidatus Krumholzibacteriota bacterium]|nr:hypothetical protein [Candidatus Krumholzibacteriota bacterium]